MPDLIDLAIHEANDDRYLTKAQARALADEVERLRQELAAAYNREAGERWQERDWLADAQRRHWRMVEARQTPDGPRWVMRCDICGHERLVEDVATAWGAQA